MCDYFGTPRQSRDLKDVMFHTANNSFEIAPPFNDLDTTKQERARRKSTIGGFTKRANARKPSEPVTTRAANILVKELFHNRSSSMSPEDSIAIANNLAGSKVLNTSVSKVSKGSKGSSSFDKTGVQFVEKYTRNKHMLRHLASSAFSSDSKEIEEIDRSGSSLKA